MADEIFVRPATIDDAESIAGIHVHAWRSAYNGIFPTSFLERLSIENRTGFWQGELKNGKNTVLVAIIGTEIVGWASGGICRDSDVNGVEIMAIYIIQELWGRGIGQKLMASLESALLPWSNAILWVLERNLRGIRFYEQNGYLRDGTKKGLEIEGAQFDELRFTKTLPNPALEPSSSSVTPAAEQPSRHP
jgi:ribosomal protein S18 acetylase RimI-like enzyme